MVFVYQQSSTPIDPWPALRHGGPNNLNANIKGKYLVLWNLDIVQREGAWHYIFQFDARDSLEFSALAQLVGKPDRYPNDINWRDWLGPNYQVISAAVREDILSLPPDEGHTNTMITDMREIPNYGRATPVKRALEDRRRLDAPHASILHQRLRVIEAPH
jgi:hypothetical protein